MQLAGVVGIGTPQEGIRPDLLQYVLVKDQEDSKQQAGKTSFWVFNKSQEVVVPGTASSERQEQAAEAVPDNTPPEASAAKQTAITDFFSPSPSTSLAGEPVFGGVQSGCVVGGRRLFQLPPFITPCPSVRLAEVPAVFHVQSGCVVEDYCDHTSPLFEREISKPSPMWPSTEPESSDNETLLGSPARDPESSFPASTKFGKEEMASTNSSPSSELAATELIGTPLVRDVKTNEAKHNIEKTNTARDEERLAGIANTEADCQSEVRNMKLVHEQAMQEMKEKLDQKDELAKSATKVAEGAAAKLAAVLAKQSDARADSVQVYQLTKRRDGLLKELESSRGKILDLTRSVEETREQLATALTQRDDTRTALAAAKTESTSAKAETTKALDLGDQLSRMTGIVRAELKSSNDKIEAILDGKGHEVIKGQIRLITLLRAENEDFEQQLHASSLENMTLKEGIKAAADNVAKNRQLYKKEMSKYKKEVQSCNARILELEAKKLEFESALQAGTGFVAVAILLRDREQTIADLTTRVQDIALLHQKEIKYENHVIEIQTELQYMYHTNDSLVREVSELKEDLEREKLEKDSLQEKVTLLQSNTLLKSRYNNICNKHTILNILMKEKLTLEKDCASLQKANAKLEQRHTSKEDLRVLVYDLLHRIIRLSHALSSRGAYPFNAAYSSIVDRAALVAQVEAEDVYADATTDGCEHEFDTEWIEEDLYGEEEEDSYDEEHGKDRENDGGNKDDNNGDEANGGSQEENRGATGKRATPNDRDTPGEACEYNNEGTQDCEDTDVMTGGKEMGSTFKSGSAKRPVFSASTPLAEEVESTTNVAADLKEMPKSPEAFKAKVRSVDPSEGHNVAVLPMVDHTSDNNDTELLPVRDVDDAYVNDVEYSNRAKKQAFMGRVGPVSAPAANVKSESGEEISFSKPFFTTKPGEATSLWTSPGDTGLDSGGTYAFGTGKNPPPSLFATPTADSKAKSIERSISAEALRPSNPAGATNPSTAAKGNSQDIWKGISFATSENKTFSFKATPAPDMETKSNEKSPVFESLLASEPVKAGTLVSEHSEAKQGSGVRKAQMEAAPATTEKASFPSQIQGFNFGEMGCPVPFTSSSPSVPVVVNHPASTEMFSFSGQKSPPVIIQTKEKVCENDVSQDESPKIDMSKIGATKEKEIKNEAAKEETPKMVSEVDEPEDESRQEKKQEKKMPKGESAPKEEIPEDAPGPSKPSRNQRRAAKKQQEKDAKKAEKETKTAHAQASRRVQQVLMMR